MLTKTQIKIMDVFVSKITNDFSIKEISELIKKPYPLVHKSVKSLVEKRFVIKNKRKLLSLNYKGDISSLAYIESIRTDDFLKKNKTIALFVNDVLEKIGLDYFTLLFFGSYVKGEQKKGSDVDVLVVIEDKSKINKIEKILYNIASNFSLKFDINVIAVESAYEMLAKRDEANIINESLNNHILVFGAENYYRLLKNAR